MSSFLSFSIVVASFISLYLIYLVFVAKIFHKYNLNLKQKQVVLPPGSMGLLPLIGETLSILIPSHSLDIHPFLKKRFKKYGPIFKTCIAGRPVVMSSDPQFNHFLFLEEGKSVELWYLDSFSKLFELDGMAKTEVAGRVHLYVRRLLLKHMGGVQSMKDKLSLQRFQEKVFKTIQTWSKEQSVDVKRSIAMMVFDLVAEQLCGYDPEKSTQDHILSEQKLTNYLEVLTSFPVNIPGTKFHKCMKVRTKVTKMIRDKIREKQNALSTNEDVYENKDLLDQAIQDMNTHHEDFLKEEFIVQIIFSILFTSIESIASPLTLAIQLLADNPNAKQELENEHDGILRNRKKVDSVLEWNEYKSMSFTHMVINETLRLTNGSPGILRRAMKDIQVNGYTIPAGWTILIATSAQHLNPLTYVDPLKFNPWRWKDVDSNEVSVYKNFMPFGAGMRQCAGAEYSKALLSIFFHVMETKYRWELIHPGKITRNPFLNFGDGVHISVSKK